MRKEACPGSSGAPGGSRLPRSSRIGRGGEIRRLLRRGKRKRTSHLDVFFSPSPVSHSRIGWVVPKHGRRIVDRNLLKRRIREIGRTEVLPRLRAGNLDLDVLIRARAEAYGAGFPRLKEELVEVAEFLCSRRHSSD